MTLPQPPTTASVSSSTSPSTARAASNAGPVTARHARSPGAPDTTDAPPPPPRNPAGGPTRLVEVRTKVLKQNDLAARELRQRFADAGVFVVSLVSSPGTGKTAFLEQTLSRLATTHRVAALVGDLATENDAQRLKKTGVPAYQIVTNTLCHLEAEMVDNALGELDLDQLDFLFIENVGNLVCPATYDLGETLRLVMVSTTEGEDKPRKYPTIFNTADLTMITKIDLAEVIGFDRDQAHAAVEDVRPGMRVLESSARTGQGMDHWIDHLRSARSHVHDLAPPRPA